MFMSGRENVSDLIAFLAVARTGSFTQAAQQLGVSQPALSHALKELERRLGLWLLSTTVEFTCIRAISLGSMLDRSERAREQSECL
jgi:DNA-binding transcriptional LysR family regulator